MSLATQTEAPYASVVRISNRPGSARAPRDQSRQGEPLIVDSAALTPARAVKDIESLCGQRTIDQALPTELLAQICELLPKPSIYSFRKACRRLRDGAHSAYGRSLNERSFVVTCWELKSLESFIDSSGCGVYMRKLRIETRVACQCQRSQLWAGLDSNTREHAEPDGAQFIGSLCAQALDRAVRRMPNLETIELALYKERSVVEANDVGGLSDSAAPTGPSLSLPRFAATRALDILVHTFGESTTERAGLPQLKKLSIKAPFPIEYLPGSHNYAATARLTEHLTKLRLTIAAADADPNFIEGIRMDQYLPQFLGTLKAVKHLCLAFPKDTSSPRNPWLYLPPLYGDHGFQALLTYGVYLPTLSTLHISNLTLGDARHLERFLRLHNSALRNLRFTNLALMGIDWKPFVKSLGANMHLDRLVFDNQMTEQETALNNAIWRRRPREMRPSKEDYRSAAKEISVNGVRIKRNNVRGHDSGYCGDEESEGLSQ